ncbi:MAG: RdgB/HAM1 family non-canonical purine NTP pyrophosphatase [Elusimicrobiales bacterium]|nr:RdgB/HAM1 family non-canonical purine NTP pyrophosphatase [Elusimicrobiales bacterium]
MAKLVMATFNPGKAREFKEMFSGIDVEILCLKDYPGACPPEENGRTFRENASIKARAAAAFSGEWALGDDTGLEVKALGGAPGIYSARYAGPDCVPEDNCRLLLSRMAGMESGREARFECSLVLVSPEGREYEASGIVNGSIAKKPRGTGGFGYDSLFVPDNYSVTFAEMPQNLKNSLSHRGRAIQQLMPVLRTIFGNAS